MTTKQRNLALATAAALVLTAIWFRGLHPARSLDRGQVVGSVLATNRLYQSLWQTGYTQEICMDSGDLTPAYTCILNDEAVQRLREAVNRPTRSTYALERSKIDSPDPIHIISFQLEGGRNYLLMIRSLEEADRGYFTGYASDGPSISGNQIRLFRYHNPALGQVLKELRTGS